MEEDQASLFPPIAVSDDATEDLSSGGESEAGSSQDDVKTELATVKAELATQREANSQLNNQLLQFMSSQQSTVVPQSTIAEPAPEIEYPDPIEDPKGYAKTVQQEATRAAKAEVATVKAEVLHKTDTDKRYNDLWRDFGDAEPELVKKHAKLVEFIVTEKVRNAAANKIDVNMLLFADSKKFIAEVARDVKSMLGTNEDELSEDMEDTKGLPSAGGISRKTKSGKKEKGPKSMMDSFAEIRKLTPGFYNPASVKK